MASLPSSVAAPEPGRQPVAFRGGLPDLNHAPDVRLPLRFMLAGLMSLAAALGILVAQPHLLTAYHYHHHVVAITHLLVLGFLLSVVFGATYQLVPVALETRLHSERLARWHFPIHLVSVASMVWMFWVWNMKEVGHFGSGLALGAGFFVWNIARTLRRVSRWDPVAFGIASMLVWLTATVAAGLAVAAAKSTYELVDRPGLHPLLAAPLQGLRAIADAVARFDALGVMHAHAHLGVLGIFILLTIAIAYRLVPMFLISEVQRPARAWASLILLNLGLVTIAFALPLQPAWKPLAALLTVAGLACYGIELAAIVHARRRRTLDWGLRAFLTAQALLVPVAALGLLLSRPGLALTEFIGRLENLYGFLALFGVVAFAILGMLYKILPFLVWFATYSREVGRSRTPTLQEMISVPLQMAGYTLWIAGLVVISTAILLAHDLLARIGASVLAASFVTFLVNAARILRHRFQPQLAPLAHPGNRPSTATLP
ncbi:MAG: hypothetical protein KF833_23055 [Verrucomicrobiae bacterium]|nr:hypothetical protein [Verrucomicrobiae bacterium]